MKLGFWKGNTSWYIMGRVKNLILSPNEFSQKHIFTSRNNSSNPVSEIRWWPRFVFAEPPSYFWYKSYCTSIATHYRQIYNLAETYLGSSLQWRRNDHDGVSNGVSIVCSTVCSGANQRKHQSSASLAFVTGIISWIPTQRASNADNVAIWWHHHVAPKSNGKRRGFQTYMYAYLQHVSQHIN